MSYTVPDYVDTKEQAILALASAVKGEAVTGGDGSVNRALDILADVMAGRDVTVPQTDAGAILALAKQYKAPVLIEKTVTANDTYDASDDDADGYSSVTVNVSGGGGGADVDLYVSGQNPAGTYTVGGVALTFEDVSVGLFTGKKATVPSGSMVAYNTESELQSTSISYYTMEAFEDDDDPTCMFAIMFGDPVIPIVDYGGNVIVFTAS